MTKKARADAKKDYAKHVAEGRPIWYPWAASDKPWPEHRWLEVDSRREYGEKGGLAYQAQWREPLKFLSRTVSHSGKGLLLKRGREG